MGYPTPAEELEIVRRMSVDPPTAQQVLSLRELVSLQTAVKDVFVHHALQEYAVNLVLASRDPVRYGAADLAGALSYGASPRASLGLVSAARALAVLRGRDYVLPEDIRDLAPDVMAHRLVLGYEALADGVDPRSIVDRLLAAVPAPRVAPLRDTA